MHLAVCRHLRGRRVPCVPPAQPAAQPHPQQPGKRHLRRCREGLRSPCPPRPSISHASVIPPNTRHPHTSSFVRFGSTLTLVSRTHQAQQSYGTVTTEVQVEVTAESSGSQTPPLTPAGSIAPVLHKPFPTASAAHDPWGSPSDDDAEPVSPTTGGSGGGTPPTTKPPPFATTSTISSARPPREPRKPGLLRQTANTWHKFRGKLANLDPIKLAYLRTSFVFAISILVTWTPSSINRVYALVYPTRTSYALNLAGAIVLPLQGLWNAIIFAATSWSTLREEFRELGRSCWWSVGFLTGSSPRRRLSDDRGRQAAAGGGAFRPRRGSVPENRELPTIPRMANVRVIRGGSL